MLGATVSIAIIIIMIVYTISRFDAMVNRINPTVSKITLIRPTTDEKPFRPQDGTFDFAFTLSKKLDSKYGFITVNHVQKKVIEGKNVKDLRPLNFTRCNKDNFLAVDRSDVEIYQIYDYYCL